MKNFLKLSLWLSLGAIFFVFSGCGDEEAKPENFKTQEAASTALFETEDDIFMMLMMLSGATETALNFDGSYPSDFGFKVKRSSGMRKRLSPNTFGYNAQTGYWTFDTTATEEGLILSVEGKIKFTPRDTFSGLPNESTNTMEYDVTFSMYEQFEESYLDLKYLTDVIVGGIADFRNSSGNATINGSEKVEFAIDITFEKDHIKGEYNHSYTIHDVIISPTLPYPQSGRFNFTIKRSGKFEGYGEDFYIKGSIIFDGTNIAILEFGGYTFHINLDGPYIVEFAQTKPSGLRLNNTSQFYDVKFSK